MRGYYLFTLTFEPSDVEDALEQHPMLDPHDKRQTRRYGDSWAEAKRTLALRVPSVVLPMSFNYLINPNHPRYTPAAVTAHGAFEYDARIANLVRAAKAQP